MRKYEIEKVDKLISEKFSSSFMNDSKWDKLIDSLTEELQEIFIYYKLVYEQESKFTSIDSPDFKPFFIEPIFYKELEWIEFPRSYTLKNNQQKTQDIKNIERIINELGHFMSESNDYGLKLYAYR